MPVPNVNNMYNNSSQSKNSSSNLGLGIDSNLFLKLLTEEMKNQDILNPTNSMDYIKQFSDFQNMQNMQDMKSDVDSLIKSNNSLHLENIIENCVGLIGKTVKGTDSNNNSVSGKVDKVNIKDNSITLSIGNKEIEYKNILSITN